MLPGSDTVEIKLLRDQIIPLIVVVCVKDIQKQSRGIFP